MFTDAEIETIVNGALEALLFADGEIYNEEGTEVLRDLEDDYSHEDATPELRARIVQELRDLNDDVYPAESLAEFAEAVEAFKGQAYSNWAREFGLDMHYTRNGHGAGFWDKGLGDHGQILTNWAHNLGDLHPFDDFIEEKATAWAGMFHAE